MSTKAPTQPNIPNPAPTPAKRLWLWIEFTGLYVLLPPVLAGLIQPHLGDTVLRRMGIMGASFDIGVPGWVFVFPLLLFTFATMLLYLRLDPSFENRRLWNVAGFKREFKRIVLMFLTSAGVLLATSWSLAFHTDLLPESGFLRLPREMPLLILMIAILYPWFSAYPQEITHRAFFFHRYRSIIGEGRIAFILNVLTFSWLHITMWNWVALVMTIPAGVIFAYTYRRSNSALAAGFEHAIYGIWVFFVGMGYFVFTGNAGM